MNGNPIYGKNSKVSSKIYLFNSVWLNKMALAVPKAPPIQRSHFPELCDISNIFILMSLDFYIIAWVL